MGVEPTVATSVVPTTDFEDRGAHRDTSTPTSVDHTGRLGGVITGAHHTRHGAGGQVLKTLSNVAEAY
jgi:hypothetical protein